MGRYTYVIDIAAPPEVVFDLWTDLDRMGEWIGGFQKATDRTGPTDAVGTRFTVWIGGMKSPTEVIEADRPRRFASRFGNKLLRGTNSATLQADGTGTRLTQEFVIEGFVPGIVAWIFGHGSYTGSFRGELEVFRKLAEREVVPASS